MKSISIKELLDFVDGNLSWFKTLKIKRHIKKNPDSEDMLLGIKTLYEKQGMNRKELTTYLKLIQPSLEIDNKQSIMKIKVLVWYDRISAFRGVQLLTIAASIAILINCVSLWLNKMCEDVVISKSQNDEIIFYDKIAKNYNLNLENNIYDSIIASSPVQFSIGCTGYNSIEFDTFNIKEKNMKYVKTGLSSGAELNEYWEGSDFEEALMFTRNLFCGTLEDTLFYNIGRFKPK